MTQKAHWSVELNDKMADKVEQGSNKIPEGWARIYAHELAGELYSLAGQLYSAENKANQLKTYLKTKRRGNDEREKRENSQY